MRKYVLQLVTFLTLLAYIASVWHSTTCLAHQSLTKCHCCSPSEPPSTLEEEEFSSVPSCKHCRAKHQCQQNPPQTTAAHQGTSEVSATSSEDSKSSHTPDPCKCPTPSGCMYCSSAKVPCLVSSVIEVGSSIEVSLQSDDLSSPYFFVSCRNLFRPPRF